MERRSERSESPRSDTVVDVRMSLALWLRAGRMQRGLSLEAVSKVTKIQPRILERLEAGKLDGLPAEVFVRGFVRSVARCLGLDEDEALRRYSTCGLATGTADLTPTVRALVEAMVELAPGSAPAPRGTPNRMQAVEPAEILELGASALALSGAVVETMMLPATGTVVMAQLSASSSMTMRAVAVDRAPAETLPVAPSTSPSGSFVALPMVDVSVPVPIRVDVDVEVAEPVVAAEAIATQAPAAAVTVAPAAVDGGQKKRSRRGKGRNKRATEAPPPHAGDPPAAAIALLRTASVLSGSPGISRELLATATPAAASPVAVAEPVLAASAGDAGDAAMAPAIADEPIATETWAPTMPPIAAVTSVPWRRPAYAAAPAVLVPSLVIDDADPDSAERVLEERAETLAPRRSFLPPILLDREDRSARQGGLTLAVIILLIAATLTLSYLMRRPSASGDGMTWLETPATYVG